MNTVQSINEKYNFGRVEESLCCLGCYKKCSLTLLIEDGSLIFVKGDGCKKGQRFAYKEMRNRRQKQSTLMVG